MSFNLEESPLFYINEGFPGGSDSKESVYNAGDPGFNPWVGKVPWRREWQPTPIFLLGKSHGLIKTWGGKELDMT